MILCIYIITYIFFKTHISYDLHISTRCTRLVINDHFLKDNEEQYMFATARFDMETSMAMSQEGYWC